MIQFPRTTKSTSRPHARRAAALRLSARKTLRWSARKDRREADKLEQWWTRKRNLDDPGGAR